jgi:hypothetical protein
MKSLVFAVTMLFGVWLVWAPAVDAKEAAQDETRVGNTAFIGYEGSQDWPEGKSAMVIQDYPVPVYIGLPENSYRVLGRIYDTRTSGFDVIGRGFDEAFGKKSHRMRYCANQAKLHGANAVVVTDDPQVIQAFGLSRKELKKSAPLFEYRDRIVLAIKLR